MSIHSSLRTSQHASGSMRNVLKRHERVRHMMTNNTWVDGRSVFGLPTIKQMKMKARKAAKEKEEDDGETPAAATPPAA